MSTFEKGSRLDRMSCCNILMLVLILMCSSVLSSSLFRVNFIMNLRCVCSKAVVEQLPINSKSSLSKPRQRTIRLKRIFDEEYPKIIFYMQYARRLYQLRIMDISFPGTDDGEYDLVSEIESTARKLKLHLNYDTKSSKSIETSIGDEKYSIHSDLMSIVESQLSEQTLEINNAISIDKSADRSEQASEGYESYNNIFFPPENIENRDHRHPSVGKTFEQASVLMETMRRQHLALTEKSFDAGLNAHVLFSNGHANKKYNKDLIDSGKNFKLLSELSKIYFQIYILWKNDTKCKDFCKTFLSITRSIININSNLGNDCDKVVSESIQKYELLLSLFNTPTESFIKTFSNLSDNKPKF